MKTMMLTSLLLLSLPAFAQRAGVMINLDSDIISANRSEDGKTCTVKLTSAVYKETYAPLYEPRQVACANFEVLNELSHLRIAQYHCSI